MQLNEISTEERLENGIRHQPNRYIVVRDENNKLVEVQDADTGRLWKKIYHMGEKCWVWID